MLRFYAEERIKCICLQTVSQVHCWWWISCCNDKCDITYDWRTQPEHPIHCVCYCHFWKGAEFAFRNSDCLDWSCIPSICGGKFKVKHIYVFHLYCFTLLDLPLKRSFCLNNTFVFCLTFQYDARQVSHFVTNPLHYFIFFLKQPFWVCLHYFPTLFCMFSLIWPLCRVLCLCPFILHLKLCCCERNLFYSCIALWSCHCLLNFTDFSFSVLTLNFM